MPNYKYTGKNLSGETVEGFQRAGNQEQLEAKLAENGVFLQTCHPQSSFLTTSITSLMKKSEITRLTRQLAVLISSGISILEAVDSVKEQIDDKRLKVVYDDIGSSIESGDPLYKAFGRHPEYFDTLYLSLLETGEISGALDISLERIADYREKSESISKKIKTALAYPALVLVIAAVVIFVLIAYVIPIFSSMYTSFGLELPDLTQRIIALSQFLKNSVLYLIILLIVIFNLILIISRTNRFRYLIGGIFLHAPLLKGLTVKLATARFCRTLGTLLSSGLQLIMAISVASRTVGNQYIERKLEFLPQFLAQGKSLANILSESGIFPKTVARMTAAGESTGRLGEMFSKTANFYESEVNNEITAVTSIIEPLIIVILGIVIAFILIAMYLPLFELIGQIGT